MSIAGDPREMDPENFGHYRAIRALGGGSFGIVYVAYDVRKRGVRLVALKKLIQTGKKDIIQMGKREAAFLRKVEHPNIVRLVDEFRLNNDYCLAMEYCPDGDFAEILENLQNPKTDSLLAETIQSYSVQLFAALSHLHNLNPPVVHRDIKPDNIFVSDGQVKLGDFGISKDQTQTLMKTVAGSCCYIAPEVIEGEYDSRADVWSTAIIIHEVIMRQYAFVVSALRPLLSM
jgi:serine/threonine protein kinase